jgi:hypothetical protein
MVEVTLCCHTLKVNKEWTPRRSPESSEPMREPASDKQTGSLAQPGMCLYSCTDLVQIREDRAGLYHDQ